MSAMLIVVVAGSGSAWTSIDRTTHCLTPMTGCHDVDVLTCCGPTAPAPIDRVPLPQFAPTPLHVVSASLMDHTVPQAPAESGMHVPSPHWLRVLDLPVLHQSFVI